MAYADALDEAERGGELAILSACLFAVPALGLLTALGFENGNIALLALVAMGSGALLLALVFGASALAGTDRARMSAVFGPLARLVMIILAVSTALQAVLLVYSIFTLEAAAIQRVHGGLLLVIGLGALAVCLMLFRAAFSFFRIEPMLVRGTQLSESEAPELHERIAHLADELGAEKPDHVVVGLEPTFFVTAAPMKLIGSGEDLEGKTLFISLGLMRLFSKPEFDAVIGHELGHFRGEDVIYSMKFAPTYSRLTHALSHLGETSGDAGGIGGVPAVIVLSLYLERFAASERTVGRHRELVADQAGASVSSPKALVTALMKVGIFSSNWSWVTERHVEALAAGRTYPRLSEMYCDVCELNEDLEWDDILAQLGAATQSHPVDTHPPLAERVAELGLVLADIHRNDCSAASEPAVALIPNAHSVDEDLSDLEAQWLLAIGAASLPALPEEDRAL